MRRTIMLIGWAMLTLMSSRAPAALDVGAIEQGAGAKGTWIEAEKVYRLSLARDDLKLSTGGVALPAFAGATSWASFTSGHEKRVMMMGEVVALADEVNPAIDAAIASGLDITALGDRFVDDEPRVFVLSMHGEGDEAGLSVAVRKVMDVVKRTRKKSSATPGRSGLPTAGPSPRIDATQPASSITPKPLDEIFAQAGTARDGIYKAIVPRQVTMTCACVASGGMGVATTAVFRGSDAAARADGEIACVYGEMQPVIKALRAGGIRIIAIGNHMDGEAPRMLFVRYAVSDRPAVEIARALRATLDAQPQHVMPEGHEHHHAE